MQGVDSDPGRPLERQIESIRRVLRERRARQITGRSRASAERGAGSGTSAGRGTLSQAAASVITHGTPRSAE